MTETTIPTVHIPGSKSHSIRALLIAAFSKGISTIENILFSSDTHAVMNAIEKLGAVLTYENDILTVDSTHLGEGLDSVTLDMENSGTGTYLLMGLAASLGIPVTITGDESLCSRPIKPLCDAYRTLGAKVEDSDGYPPFTITGPLKGGNVSIECKTSQYLSSLLLSSVLAESDTYITTPVLMEKPYVGMTLQYLDEQKIDYFISEDMETSKVKGRQKFTSSDMHVGGDYSSACFFFALAAMQKKRIQITGLDRNDSQGDRRVLDVLEKMGCIVEWNGSDLYIEGPEKLLGGEFDLNDIPDSLPILSVLATQATEKVTLMNVANARIKETDRIRAMAAELGKLGAKVVELDDGLEIYPSRLKGCDVCGYSDHRIIMSLSILDTVLEEKLSIDDTDKVSVTFPTFFEMLEKVTREL